MLIRLLRAYLPPYRGWLALLVVFQLGQSLGLLYLPTVNAEIIDRGVAQGDTGTILRLGAVMLAVALAQAACLVAAVYAGARVATGLGRDLRAAVFHRVQSFSAQEIGRFGTPSLITRTVNDVQQIQMLAQMTFTMVVAAPITIVGAMVLALRLDVPLALMLLLVIPVLMAVLTPVIRRMRPQFRLMQERLDQVTRVLREQISGMRVIRAFVRDDHERRRFAAANDDLFEVSVRAGQLGALMFPMVMLVFNVTSVAVVWVGGLRVDSGSLTVGALTAFISYLMQNLISVMAAIFMVMMIPRAEVSAERISEVLDTEPSVVPPADPVRPARVRGELELRDVEFRYPGAEQPVLHGVNLLARPGETTAIVGSTGSGKTTLVNLVPRLFDVTGGAVLLDGVDVRRLDPAVLARAVGIVPQRPYLFSGTIASNLRYGRPEATDEELWEALETAQAADFVRAMPQGLDTPVAQGGTTVSGGQRQRLAIARVLVHRPAVYLFDDSFSALDYATDAALRAALAERIADATVVVVAQRINTVRNADRIVVLDEGRVVGTGTHHELMAGSRTYREIVLSQLTEEEAA